MNNLHKITILLISIMGFSCDKEMNINAEYQETMIVYGLINPNDSISYLRIQKGFLSSENIYDAAQIQDSNQYSHKLEVKIISGHQTITFDTITFKDKDEGVFFAPEEQLYYAVTKGLLHPRDSILLKIRNPHNNHITTAVGIPHNTDHISFSYPRYNINFENNQDIIFNSIKNARIYEFTLRFHYMEHEPDKPETAVYKYFDWRFPDFISRSTLGGEEILYSYQGEEFYTQLYDKVPETSEFERYYGQIELRISTADNEYYIYSTSNLPSHTPNNDDILYSNINNGLGLFANRSNLEVFYNMDLYTKFKIQSLEGLNFKGGY